MVREIMRDTEFLAKKSEPASTEDLGTAEDLLDTLKAHRERCVGMAANMIGVSLRIIAFEDQGKYTVMFNPEIIRKIGRYEAQEGCLSLTGVRKTVRWKSIKVKYQTAAFQTRYKTYTDWTAQIIQHEIDHCDGVII
jgi:peptide deformylase